MMVVNPSGMRGAANVLSANGKHPLAAMFGRDETQSGGGYAIYCFFENKEKRDMELLKTVFKPDGLLEYSSLTQLLPAAVWYEREIKDMLGIVHLGHPDPRPLVLHESFPDGFYPLRKSVPVNQQVRGERSYEMTTAKGEGLYEVAVGPIHAGIIEPGHFRFSQAGEAMLQLDAKLFFTHRGIEKSVEGKTPEQALFTVERICGACSIANTWSYCQALEKIAGVQVPARAQIIRTLLSELERLTNHIGDLGNMPAGVGFSPAISLGGRLKERLMRLNEAVAGNRFLRGVIIPGGVSMDLTTELVEEIEKTMAQVEAGYRDLDAMFWEQDGFINRVRTTGIIRRLTAKELSMVGVGARASGIATDSRKDYDYGVYPELNFKLVTQEAGDVEARLRVRIEETAQSFGMVSQLLAMWRACQTTDLTVPMTYTKGEAWGISESARGNNFHFVALDKEGRVDRLFVRSASYPNWPAVPIATQGDIIPDFPLINKSFELCYACIDR